MIFHCPRCSAGHSVPVSIIPAGGLEMPCRRCNAAFRVSSGDRADSPRPSAKGADETAVTAAAEGDDSPGAQLGARDPQHDDAAPLGSPPDVTAVRPAKPAARDAPAPDVYARVELGVRFAEDRPSSGTGSEDRPHSKSWDERSDLVDGRGSPWLRRARRWAERLNRAPLALRVALVVFPAALGVALVLTSNRYRQTGGLDAAKDWMSGSRGVAEPVQIPSARAGVDEHGEYARAAARPRTKGDPTPEAEGAQAVAALTERAPGAPKPIERAAASLKGDDPAPTGFGFVQVADARLRSIAREDGPIAARLALGTRVREVDRSGDWVLVMVMPDGPAGFLSARLLAATKPIALLAREIAFAGCRSTPERSRDTCLFEGKEQQDTCLQSCGVAGAVPGPTGGSAGGPGSPVRCAEACRVAFDDCARHCHAPVQERVPARKRRARPRAR